MSDSGTEINDISLLANHHICLTPLYVSHYGYFAKTCELSIMNIRCISDSPIRMLSIGQLIPIYINIWRYF